MQAELAGDDRRVRQMHWGGGTPTFLSDHEMRVVWDLLRSNFDFQPDGEYAIGEPSQSNHCNFRVHRGWSILVIREQAVRRRD